MSTEPTGRSENEAEFAGGERPVTLALVEVVRNALDDLDDARVRSLIDELAAPDIADLIAMLASDERVALIQAMGPDADYEFLSELDETVRDQLSEALPNEVLAKAVGQLDTDDAAYLLESLEQGDKDEVLAQLSASDRAAVQRNLEYPEETAGRLMQADFVAVAPFWTVGQVIDFMRETEDLPDAFSEIFIVDPTYRVLGTVELSRLLRSKREVLVETLMEEQPYTVLATEDQEDVARRFSRYDLMSAPVVDENNRLLGVVTVDDVVEVMQAEVDEDVRLLGGVGDESLTDTVVYTAQNRFVWLLVNLATAVLASAVIQLFDATIDQMVALAILMPIVASMGGNAGTQTLTVAVRALATEELGPLNTTRIVLRECAVGLINGVLFAVIIGLVAIVWFGSGPLGLVIGAATVFNLVAAAVAGILIPIGLSRLGYDPAISSTVFVTTVTDVVGFFAFLGLATIWLL